MLSMTAVCISMPALTVFMEVMMLNKIIEIREAIGQDKIRVMRRYPELRGVLRYSYDPFKKYYIAAPDLDGILNGADIGAGTKALLDDLSSRELSGQAAFEAVCDHITTLNPDSAEIFKMIINKDLRAGISVKSINKAWPGLIPLTFDGSTKPDIMLLKTFNPKKVKYPCYAAVKKDGVRGLYATTMISRQGQQLLGHDHIEKQIEGYGEKFDGELCVPGEIFDVASGLIRNDQPTPESVYWIFDCPSIPGTKAQRYKWLLENISETDNIRLIHHWIFYNEKQLMEFYKHVLSKGEEGIVIYDFKDIYEDKRSYSWMRMVPREQADCKVIGFFEGRGKHAGSLGGIIVDYKGHEVKVGSGFTEKISGGDSSMYKIRSFIWNNKELFIGAFAQCEFKEKTKAGSMRQPIFKRWRFDK